MDSERDHGSAEAAERRELERRYGRQPVARMTLGEQLPVIRLHDLGTPTTLLLAAGEPVKVVSERLGHASATITRFAALLDG
jgi:integrase